MSTIANYKPSNTKYTPLMAAEWWVDKWLDPYKAPEQKAVFKERAFEALVEHYKEKNGIQ